ncbi:MAG TPA: hypothetical protein VFH70_08185 [Acidimicrobiales bacterium]|nr:hypothetical protein [Acidimicrobiales bacterium]
MIQESPPAETETRCPDCGAVLARPTNFSLERTLFLHRKWSDCTPRRPATPPLAS